MGTQKRANFLRNVWITGQVVWMSIFLFVHFGDFEWLHLVYHSNNNNHHHHHRWPDLHQT